MPLAVTKYLTDLSRLVFPHTCVGCGEELFADKNLLCWKCLAELPKTGFEKHPGNPVSTIFAGRLWLEHAFSWLFFNKGALSQHLIHQLKYKGNLELGRWMGAQMARSLMASPLYDGVDVLVPMPLNERKLKQRGFNQAQVICEGMAAYWQKPIETVAVIRSRYTQTQTRKSRLQRWTNVEHVFDLKDGHLLENKHALLVDDVITTGATMEACGQMLLKIPGLKLSVGSLAVALKV